MKGHFVCGNFPMPTASNPCNCGRKYANYQGLWLHLQPPRIYTCDFCGKEYARSDSLSRHKRSVHLGETYICSGCNYVTPYRWLMQLHGDQKGHAWTAVKTDQDVEDVDELDGEGTGDSDMNEAAIGEIEFPSDENEMEVEEVEDGPVQSDEKSSAEATMRKKKPVEWINGVPIYGYRDGDIPIYDVKEVVAVLVRDFSQ